MSETSHRRLQELAALGTEEEREQFVFQHPGLLSTAAQEVMAAGTAALPPGEAERARASLEFLKRLLEDLRVGRRRYKAGLGPIENLMNRVERGEISQEYAEELARQPDIADELSPSYAYVISQTAFNAARAGNWRRGVGQQRLLLEALRARAASPERDSSLRSATLDWLSVATAALINMPDGRIYHSALADGEQLIAEAGGNTDLLGKAYHYLGVLNLDPYTVGRSSGNYEIPDRIWSQHLVGELGKQLASIPEEVRWPPPAEAALRKAEGYLRKAVEHRRGSDRGSSLKALVDSLTWLDIRGQEVDREELARLAREALDSIDAERDPEHELALLAALRRLGEEYERDRVPPILAATPPSELLQKVAPHEAPALVLQIVGRRMDEEPRECLDLLLSAGDFFRQYAAESDRANYYRTSLRLIQKALAPESVQKKPQGGLTEAAQGLRDNVGKEGLSPTALAAGLATLARYATELSEERVGLELLDEAGWADPVFAGEHAETLAYLRAMLLLDEGSNGSAAGDLPASVENYAAAITSYLDLGMPGAAMNCVQRIMNLVLNHLDDPRLPPVIAGHFSTLALRLETEVGEPAADALLDIYKQTMISMLIAQNFNRGVSMLLLQLGKGLRFASALMRGSDYDPALDEGCAELLPHIREAEAALAAEATADEGEPVLDEDTLLTSYVRAGDRHSGDTARERLSNLQQSFDARMNAGLLAASGGGSTLPTLADFIMPDALSEALDERTVLLNFYLGGSPDGLTAVIPFLATREDFIVTSNRWVLPDSIISLGDGERTLLSSPFGVLVQSLRRSVVEYPGPWPVSEAAAESLKSEARGFLGHFIEKLDELSQAGKDHLLVVPHGPLHFYPLHLLGEPGRPLADSWKVSYLPNLRLLKRRGIERGQRREREAAALGLTFGDYNPHGQGPLPEAEAEVRAVAEIFGASPLLDAAATREAALEALGSARYVHIATHGEHNADAPAFQFIYLAPSGDSDGRLFAHELLSLDLSGLELLTLGACETALGRFDLSDNLRGLPASFLLAGVESLVGTLWPVESAPAELFFRTLYAELKAGRTRLDAFAAAQQRTRAEFDKYHQWGPFYLMGAWD